MASHLSSIIGQDLRKLTRLSQNGSGTFDSSEERRVISLQPALRLFGCLL